MLIIHMILAMWRTPMAYTHRNGKEFPLSGSEECQKRSHGHSIDVKDGWPLA